MNNCIVRINESLDSFSKQVGKVARYVLDHQEEVIQMTISELAKKARVRRPRLSALPICSASKDIAILLRASIMMSSATPFLKITFMISIIRRRKSRRFARPSIWSASSTSKL